MFIFRFIATLLRAIWHGLNTLRRILHLILLLALFAGLAANAQVGAQVATPGTVTLHYQERPPYYQTRADGGVDVTRRRDNVESLAGLPLWKDCIESGEPTLGKTANGGCEILFPLHGDNGHVIGILEVVGQRIPEARELMLINGVLRIVLQLDGEEIVARLDL